MSEKTIGVKIEGGTFMLCWYLALVGGIIYDVGFSIANALHRIAWALEHVK